MTEPKSLSERLRHAATTASNDDLSKPGTDKRQRHADRVAVMLEAADELDAKDARIAKLTAEVTRLNRLATDRRYMINAYRAMLSETGEKVAAEWDANGLKRIHFDWGPDAAKLSGEERAKIMLDFANAPSRLVTDIDGARLTSTSSPGDRDV